MIEENATIAVFTSVRHKVINERVYGYAPYIKEMNLWIRHFNEVLVVGTYDDTFELEPIETAYEHDNLKFIKAPVFNIKSISAIVKIAIRLPRVLWTLREVMLKADYLHFRSPSNIAALAAFVQVTFPGKKKSVKYAGNWISKESAPLGYKFQKWIFTSPILTKNTKVLVYGEWANQSRNVISFIQASYSEQDKTSFKERTYRDKVVFTFAGSMVAGKRPQLVVEIAECLLKKGYKIELHMYGDGPLLSDIRQYVSKNDLHADIFCHGNCDSTQLVSAFKNTHFVILPSKSEGWPKAIAEGMFFGAIPIATEVSCVPWMLDYGKRGILIKANLESAVRIIETHLSKGDQYLNKLGLEAMRWSQQFTTETLNEQIINVIKD